MNYEEKEYLKRVVGEETINKLEKYSRLNKTSQESNVLENSMWANMIDGALKALEVVSIASFDWKLIGIVKLLQSWLKDRREEKARKETETTTYVDSYDSDPWGGRTTY
jgi:hypothetical protein